MTPPLRLQGAVEEGEEGTTDEATTNEATTNEATTNEATTNEATTNEATTDEGIVVPPRTRTKAKAKNPINKYHFFHHDTITKPTARGEVY
jgi:hypothetical protein